MKTIASLVAAAVLVTLSSTGALIAADAAAEVSSERMPPQRHRVKVLRAFTAKDGTAIFRAYLVQWKEQEVIVSDSLARSNYKEGDTITILAMNHPYPKGQEAHRLLAFTIVPGPR